MKKVYLVTEYYDNGESWEDNYTTEKPVKVFLSLGNARKYCEGIGEEIERQYLYNSEITKYKVFKEDVYIECPINKDWLECEEDYSDGYCNNCQNENRDVYYDYSFKVLKIHEVGIED